MIYGISDFWRDDTSKFGIVHCFESPGIEIGHFSFNASECRYLEFTTPRIWDDSFFANLVII